MQSFINSVYSVERSSLNYAEKSIILSSENESKSADSIIAAEKSAIANDFKNSTVDSMMSKISLVNNMTKDFGIEPVVYTENSRSLGLDSRPEVYKDDFDKTVLLGMWCCQTASINGINGIYMEEYGVKMFEKDDIDKVNDMFISVAKKMMENEHQMPKEKIPDIKKIEAVINEKKNAERDEPTGHGPKATAIDHDDR